jgi:hypothetical protein
VASLNHRQAHPPSFAKISKSWAFLSNDDCKVLNKVVEAGMKILQQAGLKFDIVFASTRLTQPLVNILFLEAPAAA